MEGGFLSWKEAPAELSSAAGAAEDSACQDKAQDPAQLHRRSCSVRAGTESWITRVVPGSVFPREDSQRSAQSAVYMSQRGASASSAFTPVTEPIHWHRIPLLSKLTLLKQTRANVILAVAGVMGRGQKSSDLVTDLKLKS